MYYNIICTLLIKSEIFKGSNICFILSSSCGKQNKDRLKKSSKAGHRLALGYTNKKEVKSNPKQPTVKRVWPSKWLW